jgi:glycosyltransferase involved in cell wall biosynthesis/4-amino-4-deoxy-L-arabinose transferase-like glycosyltransferase
MARRSPARTWRRPPSAPAMRSRRVRLRILHLAFDDPRRPGSGGGAIRNHEVNRRLARHHQVTAVTVTYPGARERVVDGVHYLPVGLPLGYYGAILTYFAMLPLVVWTRRYDLLVEDFAAPFGSVLVPLWARGRVIAQVQWLSAAEKSHQYHLPFFLSERWGARAHRLLIAVSGSVGERLRQMNPDGEVVVLPNGVERSALRTSGCCRKDALFLGRLEIKGKGLDMLLEAFAPISEHTDANLVIAGDGPGREALAELVRRHRLEDRVRLLGRIDGPARLELLASAQIVCMPTRYETFGLVALEALACATPVLAFDIPAMRELLTPEASVIVPAFDVDAYARALAELLSDPERCRRMGAAGRRRARAFDWDRIARRQEEVYLRAAAPKPSATSEAGPGTALATAACVLSPAPALRAPALSPLAAWALAIGRAGLTGMTAPLAVGIATFAVRALMVEHAFEIHVDEAVYLRISQNLASSLRLTYDLAGNHPFFLHPPLFFLIEGVYLKFLAPSGDPVQQVIAVRYLVAFVGALSGAVLFALCRRLAGGWAATASAAMFALEPFIVRMDSRNFLEPSALFWVLLGLCALVRLLDRSSPRPWWLVPAAGLAFGAALLTNEPTAFITLLPLGLCALLGVIAVREAAATAGWALAAYAVYPLVVALSGNLGEFRDQKLAGVGRFVGLMVTTGFNSKAGPSFLQAVANNWQAFAPTYALLGAGLLATIWLVFRSDPGDRLIACWVGSAYALQAYAVLFGTNEEQYFYYVDVLAILAVVKVARGALSEAPIPSLRLRHAGALALAVPIFVLGLSGYLALDRYVTSDNGHGSTNGQGLIAWSPGAALASRPDLILVQDLAFGLLTLVGVAVAAASIVSVLRAWPRPPLRGGARLVVPLGLLALFLGLSGYVTVNRYTTPDDGYRRLAAYLEANAAPGTAIASTDATGAVLLRESGYTITDMALVTEEPALKIRDPRVLLVGHPRYVTVATRLVDDNYGVGSPELVRWLKVNAELVFTFRGPTDGTLEVFRIPEEAP